MSNADTLAVFELEEVEKLERTRLAAGPENQSISVVGVQKGESLTFRVEHAIVDGPVGPTRMTKIGAYFEDGHPTTLLPPVAWFLLTHLGHRAGPDAWHHRIQPGRPDVVEFLEPATVH